MDRLGNTLEAENAALKAQLETLRYWRTWRDDNVRLREVLTKTLDRLAYINGRIHECENTGYVFDESDLARINETIDMAITTLEQHRGATLFSRKGV